MKRAEPARCAAKARCAARGFGLIEVAIAITVASIGVLGAAGVVASIGSQSRQSLRDADRTVAGRMSVHRLLRDGYAAAVSGAEIVAVGGRDYSVTRVVTTRSPRLRHVELTIAPPAAGRPFEFFLARDRPMPAAP